MTAAAAGATFYFAWEPAFIIWLQAHLGVIGQAVVSFFSVFGEPVVTIGLIGFFYWGLDKELGKEIGISAALATVLNSTIKNVFIRRRPYFDHPEIKCLKAPEKGKDIYSLSAQGYSFPSGHSANVGSVFGSIIGYLKKRWVTAVSVTICAVVGFSRICLGVHYPTDVICGLAVGVVSAIIVYILGQKVKHKWIRYLVLAVLAVPGAFICTSEDYFSGVGMLLGMLVGCMFEEKLVRFENTRNVLRLILRLLGGVVVYLALNILLKTAFSAAAAAYSENLFRFIRYGIISFVELGIYPLLFRHTAKIGKKAEK